jgi:hypothetical protein
MGAGRVKCAADKSAAQNMALLVLASVGFLYLLRLVFLAVPWLYRYFLRPAKDLRGYGEWALITGSTDGIGRAMTVQFARKNINVVVLGRSGAKLEAFTKELTSKYNVQVKSMPISSFLFFFPPTRHETVDVTRALRLSRCGLWWWISWTRTWTVGWRGLRTRRATSQWAYW